MSAGASLKAWRGSRALSQTALAGVVGVGQSALAEWEAGRRRPELPYAIRLEEMTGGAVPLEAWGYPAEVIVAMGAVVRRRAAVDAARTAAAAPQAAA